jgi:aspartate/methionine/tyrosine aminotransferase
MNKIIPGTVVHYNEIGRLISKYNTKITGNSASINAHIGGQFFFSPYKMVLEAHIHHTIHHTSLLGFISSLADKESVMLSDYLKNYSPVKGYFIDLFEAYRNIWQNSTDNEIPYEEYLLKRSKQKIGSTGYLDFCHGQEESLYLMKNYFINLGLPVHLEQVVMGTGFKNLFNTFLTALMTKDVHVDDQGRDFRERSRGLILVPRGHYQSLVKAPSFHNSKLKVIDKIDGEHIRQELKTRRDIKAVYFSVVANPSGEIMPADQILGIANAVLEYNSNNKENPVYVIADQVYNGSIMKKGLEIFSIASIKTATGNMLDYTITIVSPSKTLGYASARIGFACSGITLPGDNDSLISRMGVILGHEGSDGVEVSTETAAVAAYAFSSQAWIEKNSSYIRNQLEIARKQIQSLNKYIGHSYVEINDPDAGWYILSKIQKKNIPSGITDSTDLMVYMMNYSHCSKNTGVICRPGSQFGYETADLPALEYMILRSTLAMREEDLHEFFRRYKQGMIKLAALKHLEEMSAESVKTMRLNHKGTQFFCKKMENDLLNGEDSSLLYSLILNKKTPEQACIDLKKYTENELNTILDS